MCPSFLSHFIDYDLAPGAKYENVSGATKAQAVDQGLVSFMWMRKPVR